MKFQLPALTGLVKLSAFFTACVVCGPATTAQGLDRQPRATCGAAAKIVHDGDINSAVRADRLAGPFTLRFSVKEWDPRTPAEFQSDITAQLTSKHSLREHSVEQLRNLYKQARGWYDRDRHGRTWGVTLSSQGDELLYIARPTNSTGDKNLELISLNQNGHSYDILKTGEGTPSLMVTDRDSQVRGFGLLPIIGSGLPTFTFIRDPVGPGGNGVQHANAEVLNPGADHDDFRKGFFTYQIRNGRLDILSAQSGDSSYPVLKAQFHGGRTLNSVLIPGSINMEVIGSATATSDRHPFREKEFSLKDCAATPLPPPAFVPESYLKKGSAVAYGAGGKGVSFSFDPARGTLVNQAEAQRLVEDSIKG